MKIEVKTPELAMGNKLAGNRYNNTLTQPIAERAVIAPDAAAESVGHMPQKSANPRCDGCSPPANGHVERHRGRRRILTPKSSSPAPFISSGSPPTSENDFLEEKEILKRIHLCRKSLWKRCRDGDIPYIKLGGRKIFHWPSVSAALIRKQ